MKMDTTNGKASFKKETNLFWVDNSIKEKIIYKRMRKKVGIIRRMERSSLDMVIRDGIKRELNTE